MEPRSEHYMALVFAITVMAIIVVLLVGSFGLFTIGFGFVGYGAGTGFGLSSESARAEATGHEILDRIERYRTAHDREPPGSIAEAFAPDAEPLDPWGHPFVMRGAGVVSLGPDGYPGYDDLEVGW